MADDYWIKRAEVSIGRMESAVNGQIPDLVKAFEAAKRDLNDQVERFFVRYAKNNKISLADAQKQLSLSELKDFRGSLAEYEKLAKDSIGTFNLEVDNLSVKARVTRYEALLTQCDAVLQKLYQEQKRQIEGTAMDVYTSEYYHSLFNIEQYTGFQFPFSQPAASAVRKVIEQPVFGMDISTRLWRQDFDAGMTIRQTLNNMFVTGRPPQDFADQLQKAIGAIRVDKDGNVTGTGKKYEAYRLLYNESAHAVNQAQLQAYRDDGIDEYEVVATLDRDTCDICAPQDGKHYPVEKAVEGENHPSFHVNCRCTTAPYIPNLNDLSSTRISRDPVMGKCVPTTAQTYDEWKAQQDEKYAIGRNEYENLQKLGIRRVPDIDTFQKQRYNNSPEYQKLMQRLSNVQENSSWKAVEFNPQTLDSHFEKHGLDIGAKNSAEYEAAALKFVNETLGKETVIASDGVRRFYSRDTDEFASVYPDGTISTYYKPRRGEKYWEGQVEKYGTKEK
jgi:SPP1 gp7 family putative phage head morphogenesis protein